MLVPTVTVLSLDVCGPGPGMLVGAGTAGATSLSDTFVLHPLQDVCKMLLYNVECVLDISRAAKGALGCSRT
jgi:hypothetical protein